MATVNTGDDGTATASSGAATLNHSGGVVTSESLTTAAGSSYSLTLTNANIYATSVVMASVNANGSTGDPIITQVTPSNGSVVIVVKNDHASVALNGPIKIAFAVL